MDEINMALPKLETLKYDLIVPSTGKKIQFRPFLVKEEKILLIAQESEDNKQIMNAIKDIIDTCTFGKLKINDLAIYDLEYIFLQLRAKSVGEVIDLTMKCEECETINPVSIEITNIEVVQSKEKISPKVELTDTVGVTLRPLPVGMADKLSEDIKDFAKAIGAYIESIYDEDNVYKTEDISQKELVDFVESLSHKQVEKIEKFISNQPSLSHTIKFTCSKCKHENEILAQGLGDFFA